jgi:hypothetical protein
LCGHNTIFKSFDFPQTIGVSLEILHGFFGGQPKRWSNDLKIVVGQLAQLQPRTPPTSVKTATMRFTIDTLNAIGMASEAIDAASQRLAALSVATDWVARSSSFSDVASAAAAAAADVGGNGDDDDAAMGLLSNKNCVFFFFST